MTFRKIRPWAGALVSVPLFVSGALAVTKQGPPPLGGPIEGLTAAQTQDFEDGRSQFLETEGPGNGLGPVFNGTSCGECHRAGALGGASADLRVSRVTRIGGMVNGAYSDLTNVGGPLLQSRSLRELFRNYPIPGEVVPREAQFVSHRITTPLFGSGLIEAIPAQSIVALSQIRQPDGIHGVPNIVINAETGGREVGRFGWKAQVSTLHAFAGDAYLNEMGITSPSFPHENLPQGRPIPPGADLALDPEDGGEDVDGIANYMRYLAPPVPAFTNQRGSQLFATMHCASCHVPAQQTGDSPVGALANKPVNLYSDLLLHRMGPGLADGIRQGAAFGDQFRTAPLWGLSKRRFYLHDGRASTIDQAVRMHGGEATAATSRYVQLSIADRNAVLAFLSGL
jgi:CxxC motif-containing protein (DUF1111 family)